MQPETDDSLIRRILSESKVIAIVGLSDNPGRPSYIAAKYLSEHGYTIIPVNPALTGWLGLKAYPDMRSIPEKVDVVDIFRKPETVPEIVDAAIEIGAKVVWMQEGVVNEAAAEKARRAGLLVVMDRCMKKEHERLLRT